MYAADDLYRRLVQERGDPPVLGGVLFSNLLGSGGMGLVFKGLHLRLSIPVAVKVMLSPAQGSQTPLLDEARASAHVNHPNVVRVYDLGKEGDLFYMVQEFVEGRTAKGLLDDACAGRTLSEQSVLSLGCDVARGLAAIHAAGYLHRDVKPENIIISSKDGVAKLFDLGIAVRWGLTSPDGKGEDRGPSEMVFGTPGYVSPEHLLGLPLGPASDIFGLGVTLYELLTGRLAFTDSSTAALLTETTRQDLPDVRVARPDISPATARVVRRCVKLNPEERLADAGVLLTELTDALQALEPAPTGWARVPPPAPPAQVVCVDDDTEVGGFLRETLEDAGFQARYFSDPRCGLQAILAEPPDVVIVDLHMPGLTGFQVCAAIRAAPSVADLPVVFLTGDAETESAGIAVENGATDFLLKPVSPADLVARVKCLASMTAARREFEALDAQYDAHRERLRERLAGRAPA